MSGSVITGIAEGMTPRITPETSLSCVLAGSLPAMLIWLCKGKLLPNGSIGFSNSLLLSLVTPDFVFLLKEDSMHFTTIKHLFFSPATLVTLTNSKRLAHIGMAGNTTLVASLRGQVQEEGPSICLKNAEYIFGALTTVEDGKYPRV